MTTPRWPAPPPPPGPPGSWPLPGSRPGWQPLGPPAPTPGSPGPAGPGAGPAYPPAVRPGGRPAPGGWPPPGQARRRGLGCWAVGCLTATATGVVAIAFLLVLGTIASLTTGPTGYTPPPTSASSPRTSRATSGPPSTRASASRSPGATPTPQPNDPLHSNALYGLTQPMGAECRGKRVPRTRADAEAYTQEAFACIDAAWARVLGSAGVAFRSPQLVMFDQSVQTPCGLITWHGVYCPPNQTIYVGNQYWKYASYRASLVPFTVIHEYNHHLQELVGIFDAAYARSEDQMLISRRVELQAICWESMVGMRVAGYGFTEADYRGAVDGTEGDEAHGSKAVITRWYGIGHDNDRMGACNTFDVPADEVPGQ